MPKYPEPYWTDSVDVKSFPKLKEDIKVDIAIVGGGITGITTAYLLVKAGMNVALVDADNILNGTTGHTTAKVTSQHDIIYNELVHHFGQEKAKLYYQATNDSYRFIKDTVNEFDIDCDFTEEDAYIYTNSDKYVIDLMNEYRTYEQLGIDGAYLENIPLPIDIKAAIVMKNQAQFHPLKYLEHLVHYIVDHGGAIYENTTAVDIEDDLYPKVVTRDGYKIKCDKVISCSHFPFYDKQSFYFSRMYADRSYVLAATVKADYPGGMYLSAEQPTRSLRSTPYNGENLILIGGEGHKAGQGKPMINHYQALEAFGEDLFGIKEIPYRWSTQDLTTLDKVPYIGQLTSKTENIFVATGYRKWGMTNGTAAALVLRDLVTQRTSPYKDLYSPSRFYSDPSLKYFLNENADVAKHLIQGKLEFALDLRKPEELSEDEGSAVKVNGKRAGAYRDTDGQLHIVDTTCTHMYCEVEWNSGDRTWDCPCHGSRYSIEGEVIEGPAKKPLQKIEKTAE
ncbi:FAD-dependent oxidoreductase [Desertibacillus haloalkaliphilus]|nr:FAD-dependent oxidoreductase [Desertibacillus haloalkaliphilus]